MNPNEARKGVIENKEAAKRIRTVMRRLMDKQPFFGSICLRMPLVEDSEMESIGCNGRNIYYSAEWVKSNDALKIMHSMARIVTACALKHHTRRGKRNNEAWQIASLEACVPILYDAGYYPYYEYQKSLEKFGDKNVFQIYDILYNEDDEQECQGQGGNSNSDDQKDDPTGWGSIMDSPPDVKNQHEEQQWDEIVATAQAIADKQGRRGTDRSSWKEKILGGKESVDWRTLLARYMNESAKDDYSWTRPNRRHVHMGLYLPSMYSDSIGDLVFAIDTSYSMSSESLSNVWSEIRNAANTIKPNSVTVIQCSERVTSVEQYSYHDLPESIEAKGRGSTAYKPVFEKVEEMGLDPKFLIYLTDNKMYTKKYGDEPPYPVIWANYGNFYRDFVIPCETEKGRYYDFARCPWGEMVFVDEAA